MCKCERGLKFEMEHAHEATWTQHKISTVIDQQDEIKNRRSISTGKTLVKSDVQSHAILQTFMVGFFSAIKIGHLMLQDTVTCNLMQLLVQWYTYCTQCAILHMVQTLV